MAKKIYVRKHYFINPGFQTRFLISFIVPMLILVFFIGIVMLFAARTAVHATFQVIGDEIQGIIRSKQMHVLEAGRQNEEIVAEVSQYATRCRVGDSIGFSGGLLKATSKVMILGLIVVVFELAALTVFVSHKIAGPIYRFERFAEAFGSGDLSMRIQLRKGDEMVGTADKFNKMAENIQTKIKEAIGHLETKAEDPIPSQAQIEEAKKVLAQFKA